MKTLVLLAGILSIVDALLPEGVLIHPDCNTTACILPDCICISHRIPNDLEVNEVPQTILFSFNGRVTPRGGEFVRELFNRRKRNPNGTPIRATFFVIDDRERTDYCTVNALWAYGHEIASLGVNIRTPEFWASASVEDWEEEIHAQKAHIVGNASIAEEQIRGIRGQHFQLGGNAQYEFAVESEYTYDSSFVLATHCADGEAGLCNRLWPFTMDYPIHGPQYTCYKEPCPDVAFPGMWQIPIQPLLDMQNRSCVFLDQCPYAPRNVEEVHDMLMKNFLLRFEDNRAPLLINLFSYEDWFEENPWALEGIFRFINTILDLGGEDVWFITYHDLIGWMRTPMEKRNIRYFGPFDRSRQPAMECEEGTSLSALDGRGILIAEIIVCVLAFIYLYVRDKD